MQRLDLPLIAQTETKNRRKRKRTEDVEWKPPVAVTCRRKPACQGPETSRRFFFKFYKVFANLFLKIKIILKYLTV